MPSSLCRMSTIGWAFCATCWTFSEGTNPTRRTPLDDFAPPQPSVTAARRIDSNRARRGLISGINTRCSAPAQPRVLLSPELGLETNLMWKQISMFVALASLAGCGGVRNAELTQLESASTATTTRFFYETQGGKAEAFIVRPAGGGSFPLIVLVHGHSRSARGAGRAWRGAGCAGGAGAGDGWWGGRSWGAWGCCVGGVVVVGMGGLGVVW